MTHFNVIVPISKGGENMTPNERLRVVRTELNLSQYEMGKRLGVTRGALCKIELGDRALTEQMALSICREFRVNYYWLTQGEEPMLVGTPANVVEEIAEDYDLDEYDKKIIEKYLELSEEQRRTIKNYLKSIFT